MRKTLSNIITSYDYLLHADMWNTERFPISGEVINSGLGEANLLNIAGGIAKGIQNNKLNSTIFIYGVSGFIIHRFEQLKFSLKYFGANYCNIILVNAGKYGYSNLGIGHKLDDDKELMEILKVPFYSPEDNLELENIIKNIKENKSGLYYIQLGRDET